MWSQFPTIAAHDPIRFSRHQGLQGIRILSLGRQRIGEESRETVMASDFHLAIKSRRLAILNALPFPTVTKSTRRVFGVCVEYSAASFTRVLMRPQSSIPRSNASNTEAMTQ